MMTDADEQRGVATTYNVLFVCTGNTCRSPMAEAVARREIVARGWTHVAVRSAGVAAYSGGGASEGALQAAQERNLDLAEHRATLLDGKLVNWADVILAMSPSHLQVIEEFGGGHKAALLTDFASGDEGGPAVIDPFGGDVNAYRSTLIELEDLVDRALDRLEAIVQP